MKTDYASHDQIYQRFRAEGRSGWSNAQEVRKAVEVLRRLMKVDGLPRHGRLLELGCGAGDLVLNLAGNGFELHGVDIAPTAIEWATETARARGIQADFQVGNVLTLDNYANEEFDLVLDGHCFHCIIGDDRARFLHSAWRVLKPGGALIVATMCDGPSSSSIRGHFDPMSRCVVRHGVAQRYLGLAQSILDELRSSGYAVVLWERQPPLGAEDEAELLAVARKAAPTPPFG